MTDSLVITDPYTVPITFANDVVGCGFLNGTVNITLAAARFTPTPAGNIDPDLVIVSRLRMDLYCATQLRDSLNKIIESNTKALKVN